MKLTIVSKNKTATQKKKKRKSTQQQKRLQQFYQQYFQLKGNSNLQKLEIQKISCQTSLTNYQVYKWLWDQRNQYKQKMRKQQKLLISQNQNTDELTINDYNIKISKQLDSCTLIIKRPQALSPWATKVITNQGWQLIRDQRISRNKKVVD